MKTSLKNSKRNDVFGKFHWQNKVFKTLTKMKYHDGKKSRSFRSQKSEVRSLSRFKFLSNLFHSAPSSSSSSSFSALLLVDLDVARVDELGVMSSHFADQTFFFELNERGSGE